MRRLSRRLRNGLILAATGSIITAAALAGNLHAWNGHPGVRVLRAVDGDTLKVQMERGRVETVRIIGIDAPETVDPRKRVQCFGPEASQMMHRLADGRVVTLEAKPDADRDDYGRLLRYVILNAQDLGERMIAEGYARSYRPFPHPRMGMYNRLESRARASGKGLWSACPHRKHGALGGT